MKIEGELARTLAEKGFGELVDNALFLSPFEAKYMLEEKMLQNAEYGAQGESFEKKYRVYKDLKSKGFCIHVGIDDEGVFRLFEKGTRRKEGKTKYLVKVVENPDLFSCKDVEQATKAAVDSRRDVLFAFIRKEFVEYVKISRMNL